MRQLLAPLTQVVNNPWYRGVVIAITLILLAQLIWLIQHGFRPATESDEARLVALARSFAPPNSNVRIVSTFYKPDYPLAEVDAEYDVELSAADLKRFYDKSFADKGWKQCSPGGRLFGTFSKKYANGNDSALLLMPLAGTLFNYEVDFAWEVPGGC